MSETTAISLPADAVTLIDGHVVTTSLQIASVFSRNHRDVLRAIRNVLANCPQEFGLRNFAQSDYINEQGHSQPMYDVQKDGFVLVGMGFTGRQAMRFKIAYISAFNAMEQALLAPTTPESADLLDLLARCQAELLRDPIWSKLVCYQAAKLSGRDQAGLLNVSETTVRRHQKRMQHCGLLPQSAPDRTLSRRTH